MNGSEHQTLRGMGWFAERKDGRATASVPTGKWDTGELVFDISQDDFERLRAEPESFHALFDKYNVIKGDGWTARRDDTCTVYLSPDRFADNRRFSIPNDAFERLQRDPGFFEELYSTFHTNYV